MSGTYTEDQLAEHFASLGVKKGDVVLIRAGVRAVGEIAGGGRTFLAALLSAVGEEGTIVSLAFTQGAFIKKADPSKAFDVGVKSYAGALPNVMLKHESSVRSRHPMCSYVAIGKHAHAIVGWHDENSPAYEPVRNVMQLGGKCVLVGCVGSSPGFTTTHLAESDLGLLSRAVFPRLYSTYYKDLNGELKLYRRTDVGLCSNSFYKFYALYVKKEVLDSGRVGDAYSILASAEKCYQIDKKVLQANPKFNVCDSPYCYTCNAGRWDRVYRAPMYLLRVLLRKMTAKLGLGGV